MAVSGITASALLSQKLQGTSGNGRPNFAQIQNEFQLLGQDLQSGNITQAQSEFKLLTQNLPASVQSNSTLSQAVGSLGSALQSGNLSAARQAYSTLQQDIQGTGQGAHHHRHHGSNGSDSTASSSGNTLMQLFGSLGNALTAGNLSAAQTAYSTIADGIAKSGWSSSNASQLLGTAANFLG
jgi:hypothetical protein